MSKKYNVITIGGATEDITFYTREGILIENKDDLLRQKLLAFEYGAKIKIEKAHSTFGGGAANAAVCFSRLGLRVASMVAIGDDNRGERIINNFKEQGVDTSLLKRIKNIETGFSFLLVGPGNEHIVFSNRAANSKLQITKSDLNILKTTKWIYLTSLSGAWRLVLSRLFSLDIKIAWNPGHIQLESGKKAIGRYLAKTEILILNKDEAIELVVSDKKYRSCDYNFLNNVRNLLKILKEWGPKIVVITNGKHGADAFDGEKFYHQKVLKEKRRVDTTGVGDAFGSTFVAGLEVYQDIKRAMHLAARNTASVISKQGAQNGLIKLNLKK